MARFEDPPLRTDFRSKTWDKEGVPVWAWLQYFLAISHRLSVPIVSNVPPMTSASVGVPGQLAFDANFLYIAVAPNSWRRIALVAF